MKEIIKSLKEIKTKKFWQTLGIDLVFLIAILVFAMISNLLVRVISRQRVLAIVFLVIYSLALAAIYSFFKFRVLKIILKKIRVEWVGLYILNLVFVLLAFIITFLSYLIITYFTKGEYHNLYFGVILLFVFVLGYMLLNIMQIVKMKGGKLEGSFVILKKYFFKYLAVLIIELIGLVAVYFVYMGMFNLIKGSFDIDWIFQIITLVALFFYNAFNRILFFESCEAN